MKNWLDEFIARRTFLNLASLTTACATLDWKALEDRAAANEPKENYPVVVVGGRPRGTDHGGLPGSPRLPGDSAGAAPPARWICRRF